MGKRTEQRTWFFQEDPTVPALGKEGNGTEVIIRDFILVVGKNKNQKPHIYHKRSSRENPGHRAEMEDRGNHSKGL